MAARVRPGRFRRAATTLAGLGCLAVAGCSVSGANGVNSAGYVSGDGVVTLFDAGHRPAAPVLSGALLGGGTASLASAKGKVIVLNHWSSWCSPCRDEAAGLATAARALPGAVFMGIDTRDESGAAEAFVRAQHVPYRSFFDEDGSLLLLLQRAVPMNALPTTIVLDKHGDVAARISGPVDATTLEQIVRPLEREG